jgi:hypothetical protein
MKIFPSRLLRSSCFEDNLSFGKIIRTCDVAGFVDISSEYSSKNLILLNKNLIQVIFITCLGRRKVLGRLGLISYLKLQ